MQAHLQKQPVRHEMHSSNVVRAPICQVHTYMGIVNMLWALLVEGRSGEAWTCLVCSWRRMCRAASVESHRSCWPSLSRYIVLGGVGLTMPEHPGHKLCQTVTQLAERFADTYGTPGSMLLLVLVSCHSEIHDVQGSMSWLHKCMGINTC